MKQLDSSIENIRIIYNIKIIIYFRYNSTIIHTFIIYIYVLDKMPIRDFFKIALSHIIVQKDVFICLKIVPPQIFHRF